MDANKIAIDILQTKLLRMEKERQSLDSSWAVSQALYLDRCERMDREIRDTANAITHIEQQMEGPHED